MFRSEDTKKFKLTKVMNDMENRWGHLYLVLHTDSYGHKGHLSQIIYSDNSVITNLNEFFHEFVLQ